MGDLMGIFALILVKGITPANHLCHIKVPHSVVLGMSVRALMRRESSLMPVKEPIVKAGFGIHPGILPRVVAGGDNSAWISG
jgi:hypothetical protein